MFTLKRHSDFVTPWKQAMATGLMTGRPFSPYTTSYYAFYIDQFLQGYDKVSFKNLQLALKVIPIEQFGKREKYYKAILSFAKYLIREKALPESFLDEAQTIRPRRHRPPKRETVTENDLSKLLEVCETSLGSFNCHSSQFYRPSSF